MTVKIGTLIDRLQRVSLQVKELTAKVEKAKADKEAAKKLVLDQLKSLGLESARGNLATVTHTETTIAEVVDRKKVWAYIQRNKATDLLQFRVSNPAFRERLDAGKKVPGLKSFVKHDLSVTKR